MRTVIASFTISLDGYFEDADGGLGWSAPEPELFAFATDLVRGVDVHLLGRRLYEGMSYWEDPAAAADWGEAEQAFADLWQALPKVVFSRTLSSVAGTNIRLATDSLADEIARLRAEPGDGAIALGGANLIAEAARLDLIDEYQVRVAPVLLGAGHPFFPQEGRRVDLELVETRTFTSGVVYLRHRVVHQ